ncbi:MAG: glycosyltransferase [Candidatus Limnocylindrales bacterium]
MSAGTPTTVGTVHLVYPHGDRISAPDSIGRELGKRLEKRYRVRYYDWDVPGVIKPERGDVLLGHPHPRRKTVFRQSVRQPGWLRRLSLAPFDHGDLRHVAFEDGIFRHCDRVLAITGPYWFRTLPESRCSHWLPKMTHVDLAVDRADFRPLKPRFSEIGSRRVLYIGSTVGFKNTPYLSEIAGLIPETEFGWIGGGPRRIRGFTPLGVLDFATAEGKSTVSRYDIMLTVGTSDANPTTVLETMGWGLIPVCTPQAGYEGIPSLPNVPLGDAPAAAEVVRRLLHAPEPDLLAMQAANWKLLDEHYNWDRFAAQVVDAIEATDSPPLGHESLGRRAVFLYCSLTAPHGRLTRLAAHGRHSLRRLRAATRRVTS